MMQLQQMTFSLLNTISSGAKCHRRAHCISRYQNIAAVPSVRSVLMIALHRSLS